MALVELVAIFGATPGLVLMYYLGLRDELQSGGGIGDGDGLMWRCDLACPEPHEKSLTCNRTDGRAHCGRRGNSLIAHGSPHSVGAQFTPRSASEYYFCLACNSRFVQQEHHRQQHRNLEPTPGVLCHSMEPPWACNALGDGKSAGLRCELRHGRRAAR